MSSALNYRDEAVVRKKFSILHIKKETLCIPVNYFVFDNSLPDNIIYFLGSNDKQLRLVIRGRREGGVLRLSCR